MEFYKPGKKRKALVAFDMIADMINNKKTESSNNWIIY